MTIKKLEAGTNQPLAGATFKIEGINNDFSVTKTTGADGTITLTKEKDNLIAGQYKITEVSAPAGHTIQNATQTVTVLPNDTAGSTFTFYNVKEGTPDPGPSPTPTPPTSENDVVTGTDGKVALSEMASGCYEITETKVPSPYILDTENRKTVWIDASQGKDIVVDFVNSTKPGLRLIKTDYETGKPIEGVTFKVEQVDGGYSAQHRTDKDGLIVLENLEPGAYVITEIAPAAGYVADPIPRTVLLEANKTTTVEIVNVRQPDLRILKYDQQTKKPLANVTFEVYRDAKLSRYGRTHSRHCLPGESGGRPLRGRNHDGQRGQGSPLQFAPRSL